MNGPAESALTNANSVASLSVRLVQDSDRIRLGWPRHDGKEWPPAALEYLSPDVREEAEIVAAETLADWRKAGRPHLGSDRFKATYQYLISCPAFSKHVRSLADNNIKEHE
jgi:hypothetical protein